MKPVFFQTLWFLTKVRLRAIFLCENAVWWNIARFILLLFILFAGWFYGFLFDAVLANPENTWRASRIDAGIHTLAITLVVLMNYVPSFRPRSHYLHDLFPISQRFKTGINLYGDQLNIIYGYAVIFIAMMVVGGEAFSVWSGFNALLFLLTIILIERNVKVIIEQLMPELTRYIAGIGLLSLSILVYLGLGIPESMEEWRHLVQSVWIGVTAAAAGWHYLLLTYAAGPKRPRKQPAARGRRQFPTETAFIIQLYLRRKATVITLFMLIVSKAFMTVYAIVLLGRGEEVFGNLSGYYLIALLLPIIPFSYVHNNFAGFFRESWTQFSLQSGKRLLLLKTYIYSLLPVLILDITVSFIVLASFSLLNSSTLLYYMLAVSLFIPLGMIASLHHARYIERFFSVQNMANFRNNSSGLYLLLFFAIALLLGLAMFAEILIWLIIPVLLLSAYLFAMLPRYYENKRYSLYSRLYEE